MTAVTSLRMLPATGRRFLAWWFNELSDARAEWVERLGAHFRSRFTLFVTEERCWVEEQRAAEVIRHVDFPLAGGPTVLAADVRSLQWPRELFRRPVRLVIPPSWTLTKTLTLPVAIRRHLRSTVELQLQRHVPVSIAEIYWDVREATVEPAPGRLRAQLAVAKRGPVDALVARLAEWGVRVGEIESPTAIGRFGFVRASAPAAPFVTSRVNRLLGVAIAALAVAFVGSAFLRQAQSRATFSDALEASRTAARPAAELRDGVAREARTAAALAVIDRAPSLGALLADLSARLPADTWIERLTLQEGRVRLNGYAPIGFDVAAAIERSPLVARSALQSTASAGLGTGQDRFEIELTLVPDAP